MVESKDLLSVVIIMPEELPFKNREEVKAEIRLCATMGGATQLLGIIFAAIGVGSDALDFNIILEPTIWLLLAIWM